MIDFVREKTRILVLVGIQATLYYYHGFLKIEERNLGLSQALSQGQITLQKMTMSEGVPTQNERLIEKRKKELEQLKSQVSTQTDATVIGKNLNDLAEVYGIRIVNLSYGEPSRSGNFYFLPINLKAEGVFFRMGDFLKKTEDTYPNVSWQITRMTASKHPELEAMMTLIIRQVEG